MAYHAIGSDSHGVELAVTLDLGKAVRLGEMLGAGLSDVGRGLARVADHLESGESSPADAVAYLRAMARELKALAESI